MMDRQSKKTMWHRVHQHSLVTSLKNASTHYKLVVEDSPGDFSAKQRKEMKDWGAGTHNSLRLRWRLFHELAAYSMGGGGSGGGHRGGEEDR